MILRYFYFELGQMEFFIMVQFENLIQSNDLKTL